MSDTLEESPNFISKTMCPNVPVFVHHHEVSIFEDISSVVVNDGTDEVNGGVIGWRDCFQEDAFRCKRIPAMKQRWMSAKGRCGHEFVRNDAIYHMGSA